MFKKISLSVLLLSLFGILSAKDLKYPVSEIPAALKENAHTVMRVYKQEVEIKSEKSAVVSVTEVRTILNKNGERNSYFIEMYNPMNKITALKAKVYDETGKQIRSFGADDAIDRSAISDFSMYEENRIKIIDPKNQTYPFTVEYTYQMDMKQTLFLPSWNHGAENTSFENSTFIAKGPSGYTFRYKEYNISDKAVKTTLDGKDIYTWNLKNLKARTDEPMASITTPDYPLVLLAPNSFVVGESKGSAESWKDLGKWASSLILDKDKLPDATIAKVKEMTANCKNDAERIKVIYEYMQQKTRYVSIQIGIGGWQPFDATTVDKTSYGDCKALSNYTHSLLSAIGVKSYYTLVRAGSDADAIDYKFPSSQFNHAIVCVPFEKDTIWLECTSQRLPFGFNSDFTDDREVLLIDGENSRLVHTRVYSASENCINRFSSVKLDDEDSGEAKVTTHYIGLCYDQMLPIYYADNADKLKRITQSIELPSFKLNDFILTENRSKTPSFDQKLNISVTNYIHKLVGNIALLPLSFMNKLSSIPDKVRNRKTEMCIRRPYMENDTVIYEVPASYEITQLPDKVELKNEFGNFSTTASLKGNSITYIRHFELNKGVFPASAYTDYRDFLEKISTADGAVASLKKL